MIAELEDLEEVYSQKSEETLINPNLIRYLEICSTSENVGPGNQEAKGFVRVKIANRGIITRVLIDSGNLFGTLMSESFCKRLTLPVVGRQLSVGTASKTCLLYTSPSPRDLSTSRMPSSA